MDFGESRGLEGNRPQLGIIPSTPLSKTVILPWEPISVIQRSAVTPKELQAVPGNWEV